ncbi:hypothetical protein ACRAWD_07330 [Caulobacter segnis]
MLLQTLGPGSEWAGMRPAPGGRRARLSGYANLDPLRFPGPRGLRGLDDALRYATRQCAALVPGERDGDRLVVASAPGAALRQQSAAAVLAAVRAGTPRAVRGAPWPRS